jgi:hypothetical protein
MDTNAIGRRERELAIQLPEKPQRFTRFALAIRAELKPTLAPAVRSKKEKRRMV